MADLLARIPGGPVLGVARLAYVGHAVAAAWVLGVTRDPGLALLTTTSGLLALAAATWVTSEDRLRGALASVGIVVGAIPVGVAAVGAGLMMAYVDAWPQAVVGAAVLAAVVAIAAVMWRHSRRPWETDQPPMAR